MSSKSRLELEAAMYSKKQSVHRRKHGQKSYIQRHLEAAKWKQLKRTKMKSGYIQVSIDETKTRSGYILCTGRKEGNRVIARN